MSEHRPAPEFSHPVVVAGLSDGETALDLTARPTECSALAARYGVDAVRFLKASMTLKPLPGGDVRVQGGFEAGLVQRCVVTLEPVETEVAGTFSTVFSAHPIDAADGHEIEFDAEAPDPADTVIDGVIDVGEVVAELVALEIDPFPRADGVSFEMPKGLENQEDEDNIAPNPFAKLANLKEKLERGD